MVETKAKTTVTRARIAHKLAKYYRATPIHLTGVLGSANPSTSHLSNTFITQPSVEPPSVDSETRTIPGIPLMTRQLISKELPVNPKPPPEENPFKMVALSSFFQAQAEEEELLFLNHSSQVTF